MASLYKEALKNAQKQQDEFRKYVEKSAAKQSKKKTEPQPIPRNQSTSEIPARSKEKHKSSSGRHRIDADTREILNKEVQTNPIPQAITRFNEKVVNDIALAPVTIPYQIATGKKLIDFGLDPETESAKVGAGVGNFLGTAASYALGYKAAGKAISKGAEKILASEAGKKTASKIVGSALGRKAGQEAAENVVGGIARNIVGDATVGTLLNLADARGRGLGGEELAKDMALNAAIDFGIGNALEFLPMAAKAIKNVKTEPRIVNGKVKYVKVNNTANQTAGADLPFADSAARGITFANSAYENGPRMERNRRTASFGLNDKTADITRADGNINTNVVASEVENVPLSTQKKVQQEIPNEDIQKQFVKELQGVITGDTPTGKILTVMHTPEILREYGVNAKKLTMTQDGARKAMYPKGYQGLKQGHNLGFGGLEMLPSQLENPIAILDSFTQKDSRVIITNMLDENNNPVIAAIHLNKDGRIEYTDEIASVYGKNGYQNFIDKARKNGKVLYENKKIGLDAVPSVGLQLPGANHSSDPMNIIANNLENVNKTPYEYPNAGITDEGVAVKAPRGSVKARGYERRQINQLKQNIKSSLGVNKYSDNAKMNALIDEAVEKMKNGRLSDSEKNALFDTLFEEGIITDTAMFDRYSDLKRDLRSTAIKVTDDIKANIPDFQKFRQETFGKLRLNDAEGMAVDDLYTSLRMQYPELFPELNTTSEMVQRLAEVAGSIKQTETRLTHAFSTDIETLRAETKAGFDAAMDEMEKQVNIVSKYLSMPTVISSDEATAYARNIKQIQRDIENLSSKILLDDEDWGTVDMLLKGRISPKTVRQININAENIITMYEAKAKLQAAEKGLADIKAKTRAEYTRQAEDSINGSELWQDRAGFRMSRETPERVMYDIAGKESGQKLIDNFIQPIHQNEAISTKMKNELRGTVKELNISTEPQYEVYAHAIEAPGLKEEHLNEIRKTGGKIKLSESALVQLYGEGLIDTDVLTIVGADVPKIQNAVTTMRQIYNQLIDAANQELIRHGYEPIEYRKDYFPHFTEERPDGVLANIADKLGIKILKDELPTDIAGLTHTFRPGKKWFGNALSRTGRYTEYDAIKGFDIYLEGIADVIHHTEDIQKLRTLENTLRLRYSDEGVRSEILKLDEQMARGEISEAVRDARAALIFDAGDTKLGSFATWLRNYTDSLAGKKTLLDRTFEHAIGRTLYNSSKAIENRVAANMVSLNPASWLTNFIPIVQAGEVKQINLIKGMAQTINNKVRPDNFADTSVFLTNRKGSDVLWKSSTEKWQDILSSPMKWIDEFTSETITRAKYLEEIDKGASPAEAMRAADDLAASIIADRSKGALPNVFNSKNPISKILTMYQVEVNNQWSHLLKDIPRTEGNVKRVAMAFTKYAIASYLFNDIYEYFIGRRPALDPISWVNDFVGDTTGKKVPNFMDALFKGEGFDTEQKTGGAAVAGLGKNIAQDIPFAGGLLEGGRVPISSALPSASKLAATGGNLITGDVPTNKALYDIGNELAKPLTYMALPYGGGQIKKIVEGTETFIRKGNYAVNNDGEDELRYAVDPTAGNLTKGLLFGRYSMGNANEYINSGFKRLSKNNTQAYKAAVKAGASPQETENFLRSLKGKSAAEIRKAIMDSDFTPAQKNAIGLTLEKDKTIDYSSQTSYKTSLLTPKQQEKVSDLKITGLSDEDALEAYNMYLNADGSDVAKSIEMLTKRSYQNMVFEVLGISNGNINKARELTSAGITGKQYDTVKKLADANGSGQVSIEEAKAYLDSKSFTRKEKFALVKALTECKDKNNPYR